MTTENNTQHNNDVTTHDSSNATIDNSKAAETVPLSKFLEHKQVTKELKERLAGFEAKEKKELEAKLLEEKNFQEVIQTKSKEAEDYKSELEKTKKEYKLKDLQNRFARSLDKNNAIDSNDILKLVDVSDLMDSESADAELAKRVDSLIKGKPYLFEMKGSSRSTNENNTPNATSNKGTPNQGVKVSSAMEKLQNIYQQ